LLEATPQARHRDFAIIDPGRTGSPVGRMNYFAFSVTSAAFTWRNFKG
jgi:hypothetical protein